MPQAADLSVDDAQATPVSHTFTPIGRDGNGVFWYEDMSAPSAIGNWKISVEVKKPTAAAAGSSSEGRSNRVKVGLHEPVLETVSNSTVSGIAPAPTLAYTSRAILEFVMPERATLQNRKDLRKMIALITGNTQMIAVVEQLQYLW